MDNEQLARYWMAVAGISLLGAGLLGFVAGNPIASEDPDAIFRVNAIHNVIHLVTGALALGVAYGTRGRTLANATIGYGALYGVVAVLLLADPTLFGLFEDAPANAADHVLHAALAVVSVVLGYMARERAAAVYRQVLDLVCDIPGATASTAAWHAAIELGLTAVVLVAGSVFLVAGMVAFRRSARDDARGHPVAMTAPPDAAAGQPLAWRSQTAPTR